MDHFSTVLQRPPHFDEDGSNGAASEDRAPRGGLRDILNPVSSAPQQKAPSAQPGGPAPPRAHPASFSLRSPTQSDLHHPVAYSASPPSSSAGGREPSGPRSILNNPFMSATAAPLPPPPLQAPPVHASSATTAIVAGPAASSSNLQHPPRSPLHAPPVYYATDLRDREPPREKLSVAASNSSSFYDPTADAASKKERERTVSDAGSWRTATQVSTPKVSKPWAKKLWARRPVPISTNSQSQNTQTSFFPPPPSHRDPSFLSSSNASLHLVRGGSLPIQCPRNFPFRRDQATRPVFTRNINFTFGLPN
jgi:DNA helicase INO80